jgi:hypothetical protein
MNIAQFFNLFKRSPAVKVIPIGKIVSKPKDTTPKVLNEGLNNASGAKVYDPHKKHCGIPLTATKESIFHDDVTFFKNVYDMPIRLLVEMNSQHRQILMRKLRMTLRWLEGIDRLAINLEEGEA